MTEIELSSYENLQYIHVFCAKREYSVDTFILPRKYAPSGFSSLVRSLLPKDTLLRTYLTTGLLETVTQQGY